MVIASGTWETMTDYTASAATPARFELAEGIIWDDRADLVRWVDIWKGRLHSGRLAKRFPSCATGAL